MSKEWKCAAEAYAISTDGQFEYAKSWEEVIEIFMAGANHASKAIREEANAERTAERVE